VLAGRVHRRGGSAVPGRAVREVRSVRSVQISETRDEGRSESGPGTGRRPVREGRADGRRRAARAVAAGRAAPSCNPGTGALDPARARRGRGRLLRPPVPRGRHTGQTGRDPPGRVHSPGGRGQERQGRPRGPDGPHADRGGRRQARPLRGRDQVPVQVRAPAVPQLGPGARARRVEEAEGRADVDPRERAGDQTVRRRTRQAAPVKWGRAGWRAMMFTLRVRGFGLDNARLRLSPTWIRLDMVVQSYPGWTLRTRCLRGCRENGRRPTRGALRLATGFHLIDQYRCVSAGIQPRKPYGARHIQKNTDTRKLALRAVPHLPPNDTTTTSGSRGESEPWSRTRRAQSRRLPLLQLLEVLFRRDAVSQRHVHVEPAPFPFSDLAGRSPEVTNPSLARTAGSRVRFRANSETPGASDAAGSRYEK
ncbi:MAG: hypothetical protein BJ554DRAFT_4994, partial [Olpidium bornovanus]